MDQAILHRRLKAGYLEKGVFVATTDGTPQGGIISPALANATLDGLETLLQEATEPGLRGRVFASRDFIMRSVLLVAVSAAGAVTRQWGPQAALVLAGVLVLGAAALAIARLEPAARTPR